VQAKDGAQRIRPRLSIRYGALSLPGRCRSQGGLSTFDVQAIRQSNPLRETVERETGKHGQPVHFKKAGRWWQCICPLHADKDTPSFSIEGNGDFYRCFGCPPERASGDVIAFVMHLLDMDFRRGCEYLGGASDIDAAELERLHRERDKQLAEQAEREARELQARRQRFAQSGAWKRYHANLCSTPSARQKWHAAGINEDWQDFFGLGYTPDLWAKQDEHGLGEALVIPYFTLQGQVVTAQYRFTTPNGMGKYLFHPDLGAVTFFTRRDLPLDQVLVVEGMKKAAVAHIWGGDGKLLTLGTPSENYVGGDEAEHALTQRAKEIWWWPDPGDNAFEWAIKHIQRLGIQNKTKVVRFRAAKVDDALLGGLTAQGFKSQLATARLASVLINRRRT
jgi:hypothetical protein